MTVNESVCESFGVQLCRGLEVKTGGVSESWTCHVPICSVDTTMAAVKLYHSLRAHMKCWNYETLLQCQTRVKCDSICPECVLFIS